MSGYILAIDQGTTSTRAIIFRTGENGLPEPVQTAQEEFPQHFPASGLVEHNPEDLWETTIRTCRDAIAAAGISAADLAGIGITNQRETTVVWDKNTGLPVHNAIVWQDRRTADYCDSLRDAGLEDQITAKTGLLADPYFSATKLRWILENTEGARDKAEAGDLLFGTVDTFLIWRLTGGRSHVTDATNAARTMLYNIQDGCWDADLLKLFDIPASMLPEVLDCAADFGVTGPHVFDGTPVPILGVAGDQQAATVGQACFAPGMMKSTYGTGCFALMNTGDTPVLSENRLLTTIAYQLNGKPAYALEGSIFIAGAVVQWLRDGLQMIGDATEAQPLAESADPEAVLTFVPAFTGLGAPYWNAECRGAIFGLTRGSGPAEIAQAALQSVAFQTRDLVQAMQADWEGAGGETVLRVDGGMANSDWTMQALANQLQAPVDRPIVTETTALGVAWLAGMQAGICPGPEEFSQTWALDQRFEPQQDAAGADTDYARWQDAVNRLIT
ncbi:glycerol kinase GlpK [Halocynthiibacter styelae]|uniref:glycerol kinase n=1 Tax=Halocynthiibacter styelae TaxID=2761955 RepID=A0A8J7IE77_9RHOB|nr:glycerol kinase GlpK [Paenihalocynthiibacter styelae]MBI1495253.1 glycerol kinase GlpK [Paenihalocynthiibacter styelae]